MKKSNNDIKTASIGLSISEFTAQYNRHRTWFYILVKAGKAPLHMKVNGRTVIPRDAAQEWEKSNIVPAFALAK